jgi:uncharacterized iron-regulated membrane protein
METSTIAFLLALIAFLVLAIIGATTGWLWWKRRRRLARLRKALNWVLSNTPAKETE